MTKKSIHLTIDNAIYQLVRKSNLNLSNFVNLALKSKLKRENGKDFEEYSLLLNEINDLEKEKQINMRKISKYSRNIKFCNEEIEFKKKKFKEIQNKLYENNFKDLLKNEVI